jgi:hypothetical protein
MASGHVNRTYRPNTWPHRPSLRREDSSCQPGAVHTWHFCDVHPLRDCLLIEVDRKSSAHPQNDLTDPNPTSASDPTGAEHRRCETIHIQIARLELSGCGPV